MFGTWVFDLEATLAESPLYPEDVRATMRRDAEAQRFELRITDREYVSRSRSKTVADRYSVLAVDGDGTVTIALSAADDQPREQRDRSATLRLREDGKLLIYTRGELTAVMSRPWAEGG